MTNEQKTLRTILLKENILTGANYIDWYRKLKIILKAERTLYILTDEEIKEPHEDATQEEFDQYEQYKSDALDVECLMLSAMSPELQKQNENLGAKAIDLHLKELFTESARNERYETSRSLFSCRMQDGSSVSAHVLKMIGYIERLEVLGFKMDKDLYVDLVLQSLTESYKGFVMNFNINQLDRSLPDLLNMLRVAEKDLKKAKVATPVLIA